MLLYPDDHAITIGELREIVYDDISPYQLEDDRYTTWIERYPDDWRMAAYAAADRLYQLVASKPTSLGSDGDSIAWSPERIAALKDKRDDLAAMVEADGMFGIVTVTQSFLTGATTTEDAAWF